MTSPGTITLGSGAGRSLTAASHNNVLLGLQAGSNLASGSSNIVIGPAPLSANVSRNIIIGAVSTAGSSSSSNDVFSLGSSASRTLLVGDMAAGNLSIAPTGDPNWGSGSGILTLFNGSPPTAGGPAHGIHLYAAGNSLMIMGGGKASSQVAMVGAPATQVAVVGGSAATPPILIGANRCGLYDTTNGIGISINGVQKTNISASSWNFSNQSIITTGGIRASGNVSLSCDLVVPGSAVNIGTVGAHQINIGNQSAATTIVAATIQRSSIWYNVTTISVSTVLSALDNYGLIRCAPSSNALITLQLPATSSAAGRFYIIINTTGQGSVRIYTTGADLIDNNKFINLDDKNQHTSMVSDGVSSWLVI